MTNIHRIGECLATYCSPDKDLKETIKEGISMGTIDLRYADFKGCDLSGVNFSNIDLTGADFSNANLQGAHFINARMHNVNMSGADAEGAIMMDAKFKGANLRGAALRKARLQGADLSWADVYGADFSGANLSNVILYRGECMGFAQAVRHTEMYKKANPIHTKFGWDIGAAYSLKDDKIGDPIDYRIIVESRTSAPHITRQ